MRPSHIGKRPVTGVDRAEPPPAVDGLGPDGVLPRGALAPMLYHLGRHQVSGELSLAPAMCAPAHLRVARGVLLTGEIDPLGRTIARRLATICSMRRVRYRFEAGAEDPGALGDGADVPGLPLAAWARTHIESQLDTQYARQLLAELAGPTLALASRNAPPCGLCDDIDRRILSALETPQPLYALWRKARTSRYRLLSFLHFLRTVGALHLRGSASEGPRAPRPSSAGAAASSSRFGQGAGWDAGSDVRAGAGRPPARDAARDAARVLGVGPTADRDAIRRAFHRRARALHPDLHPGATRDQQRRLEHALVVVTDAYEVLIESACEPGRRRKP